MKLKTEIKKIVADTKTPVSIYLALRDKYFKPLLLESSDYNSKEGNYSYICLNPIAEISIQNDFLIERTEYVTSKQKIINAEVINQLEEFRTKFSFDEKAYKFCYAGLFGFTSFEGVALIEDLKFSKPKELNIPTLYYGVFSIILVFDHNSDSLYLISHSNDEFTCKKQLSELEQNILFPHNVSYPFHPSGEISVNISDNGYMELVKKAQEHCQAGDVFQLVLSKRFSTKFKGDEFSVYRALRNINPSPYLFYFDLGNYKLFGSSPEAQLVVQNGNAEIHPIAGTYKRTGNDLEDTKNSTDLLNDPKEESEHMMLVDLARNDLSKYCKNVKIAFLKQIQYYSHVIHLVSKVKGELKKSTSPFQIVLGTFPAGTLSGAPKHKALQLINTYETAAREFYGGCIGYISNTNEVNHAIMIRTFLSKDYNLVFQAGAGVVVSSDNVKENEEVHNKINVLKKAIIHAEKFNNITKSKEYEITSVG